MGTLHKRNVSASLHTLHIAAIRAGSPSLASISAPCAWYQRINLQLRTHDTGMAEMQHGFSLAKTGGVGEEAMVHAFNLDFNVDLHIVLVQ